MELFRLILRCNLLKDIKLKNVLRNNIRIYADGCRYWLYSTIIVKVVDFDNLQLTLYRRVINSVLR